MASLEEFLVFKDVAQTQNITKTSKRLHMSQPCVSIQIQNLEKEYRAQLLDRTNRGVTLTPSGEIFYRYVEEVIQLTTEAHEAILKAATHDKTQRIRIGASLTIGEYLLPLLVEKYYQKDYYADINACICNTEILTEMIANRELHIALIEGPIIDHPELSIKTFWHDELVVIVPATHRWSKRTYITFDELTTEKLITREKGSGTRATMEQVFEQSGFDISTLDIRLEMGSTHGIKQAVKSGIGITILSSLTVQKECRLKQCVALHIQDCSMRRPLSILTHKKCHLTPHEQAFIFLLTNHKQLAQLFPEPVLPA